jgi:3-oxoacyl-[acyl-carrier-protein] synthase II
MLFPWTNPIGRARVVVTGTGIITAYGVGWEINADNFRKGSTAFRPVTLFDVSRQRVKTAAQADVSSVPATRLTPRQLKRSDRAAKLLIIAAEEALNAARLPLTNLPIVLGTTSGGMSMGEAFYRHTIDAKTRVGQASRVANYLCQHQAMNLCEAFGLNGPITIIANACAAGANAIGHAYDLIKQGRAERVVAGGYDALSQLVFAGFDALQALSPTVCRPFDKNRDGLALGEGAALLVLESLESATKRNAQIYGEISGYGACTDAHHLTQPHPHGDAALASMSQACSVAGVAPEQVGYLNAHGTGTPLNDGAEASAINRWAGEAVSKIRVSSTKAGIGHLLGAAGAVETVACLMALRGQWLPPEPALNEADPGARFPVVRETTDCSGLEFALTNSFGFGGANASLLLRRWA